MHTHTITYTGAAPRTWQDGCIKIFKGKEVIPHPKDSKLYHIFCTIKLLFDSKSSFSDWNRATYRTILHQDGCNAPVAGNWRVQMHPLHPCCRRPCIHSKYKLNSKQWNEIFPSILVNDPIIGNCSWFGILKILVKRGFLGLNRYETSNMASSSDLWLCFEALLIENSNFSENYMKDSTRWKFQLHFFLLFWFAKRNDYIDNSRNLCLWRDYVYLKVLGKMDENKVLLF